MTGVQIVSADQIEPTPWANAQGSTRTLLSGPNAGNTRWRVALAHIDRACDFSVYVAMQRWLAVVDGGDGIVLTFAERRVEVRRGGDAAQFSGATAPTCELLNRPVLALNVMWHRATALTPPVAISGGHDLAAGELLYCVSPAHIVHNGAVSPVPAHSLVRTLDGITTVRVDAVRAFAWPWGASV